MPATASDLTPLNEPEHLAGSLLSGSSAWPVLASAIPLPVIGLSPDWSLHYLNPCAAALFTPGRSLLSYIPPRTHEWLLAQLASRPHSVDTALHFPGGKRRFYTWALVWSVMLPDGESRGCLAIGQTCPPARRLAVLSHAARLTAREHEILRLTVDAYSNANIAAQLSISPSTVKNHLKAIFLKIGVGSRMELAACVYGAEAHGH